MRALRLNQKDRSQRPPDGQSGGSVLRKDGGVMRDIVHEQVSASTDAELADRLAVLIARYDKSG